MASEVLDYLEPEGALKAHLPSIVPAEYRVLTAADLAGVQSLAQLAPAVFVVFVQETNVTPKGGGRASEITQLWSVVVNVRNVRQIDSGEGVRGDVGPVIASVIRGVSGWSPGEGWAAFQHVRAPYRMSYRDGVLQFPLAFTTTCQLRINP